MGLGPALMGWRDTQAYIAGNESSTCRGVRQGGSKAGVGLSRIHAPAFGNGGALEMGPG